MARKTLMILALLLCLCAAAASAAQPAPSVPAGEAAEALLLRAYFHLNAEAGQGPLAALADLDAYEATLEPGAPGDKAGGRTGGDRGLAPALLLRSVALRALGRHAEAVAAMDRLLLLPGPAASGPEAFTERGIALAALGRHDRALEDFGQALAQDPGHIPALMARGDLRFALGRAGEAEADYTEIIARAPGQPLAWVNRGVARDEQRRHAEAVADFTRALALDPDMVSAWAGRGIARSQLGDMAGMCADYREACARGGCRRLGDARAMGYCEEEGGGRER